jgi:NAD(P)-dependent dehydrogenase (short-subunit alcohol dehydrogenase family)
VSRASVGDRVAIITGAGSGIGRALAHALFAAGAHVVATDVDASAAKHTATSAPRNGHGRWGSIRAARLDVTDAAAFTALVDEVATEHGRIDYLFNNAGIGVGGEVRHLDLEDWRRVLAVNLSGVVHGVTAVYPRMIAQRSGHIVNVASVAGLSPYPLAVPYTASKHAVVGLSHGLRTEAAGLGVRVSVVCPGTINTAIWTASPIRGGLDRELAAPLLRRATSAAACAEVILRGVDRNLATIIVTKEAWLSWMIHRVSPTVSMAIHGLLVRRLRRAAGNTPR